ncbi:NAD(P)H-binding protein [Polaromonas sp. YR568]|uniref:NAD(P)H-binding protein n=1 Tax=Polaromonas sp. YR568 TaxID=1855301 RepID=UPI00398BD0BD
MPLPTPRVSGDAEKTSPLRVLVLGGTGFIGRHAVAALHAAGAQLAIGSRHPERHEAAYPFAALRPARFEQLLHPDAWATLLKDVNVVVNCVGILRQRPNESYEHVHHRAPAALALACAKAGIRFIHTSALGLHEGAKSRFLSSKLLGERAIAASGSDYAIVRPSLLDGEGGFGARWLRGLSRSPVHGIPRGARGGIAAMTAADLGLAFAALAAFPSLSAHREVELGGTRRYGYAEYLRELRADCTGTRALQLPLPNWMARLGAHACDLTHFSPFSYGHWILLQRDNIPSPNRLPELLGREPHAVGSKAPREPGPARAGKIGPHDLPDTTASRSP